MAALFFALHFLWTTIGIGIGFFNTIGIGIGIVKTIFKLLVLVLVRDFPTIGIGIG